MVDIVEKDRFFITGNGSVIRLFGKHGQAWDIDWDWVEEGCCCDCGVEYDVGENMIRVHCDYCENDCREIPVFEVNPNLLAGIERARASARKGD